MTVSSMLDGDYGIDGLCLSLINIVGEGGIRGRVLPPLTDSEMEQLHRSADSLRAVIESIKF